MTAPEPWQVEDAIGSFNDAIAEIGRRVKEEGEEPRKGYFQSWTQKVSGTSQKTAEGSVARVQT